jgi:AcrR family transcriptional regulator
MTEDEKLRADARANRGRILEVARQALTSDPGASLNQIAKAAGIGAGTLYRHFPNREALLAAVYHQEVQALVQLAPALLDTYSPLEALHHWCERFANAGSVKQGIADTLNAAVSVEDLQHTYRLLVDAVRVLMEACEQVDGIGKGHDPEAVLTLLSSTLRIRPGAHGKALTKRVLDLIILGLRPSPST